MTRGYRQRVRRRPQLLLSYPLSPSAHCHFDVDVRNTAHVTCFGPDLHHTLLGRFRLLIVLAKVYEPRLRERSAASNSASGNVFNTSEAWSQPRRAVVTPKRMFDRCAVRWESVETVKRQPRRLAERTKWLGRSSRSGLEFTSKNTSRSAALAATFSKSKG